MAVSIKYDGTHPTVTVQGNFFIQFSTNVSGVVRDLPKLGCHGNKEVQMGTKNYWLGLL